MNHLEIEYKSLLTQEEFESLLPLFREVTPIHQTNHYFDTPDWQLRNHHSSLRIRTFETHAELTLKISQTVGNMEYNQDVTLEKAEKMLAGGVLIDGHILETLTKKSISVEKLHTLGSLTTIRREMPHEIGLLALDESYYFDTTDYELEVEVDNAKLGEQAFFHFLENQDIQYKSAQSKIARFVQSLPKT